MRSNYSSHGEPLYETSSRRRASIGSRTQQPNWDDYRRVGPSDEPSGRPSSRFSNGYGGRPLSRARSMSDIRYKDEDDRRSLRRSRSSNSFGRISSDMADSGYNENQSNSETENTYEFLNVKPENDQNNSFENGRPPSPARSSYSVRTAPSRTGHDDYYQSRDMNTRSAVWSTAAPDSRRNRSLRRSMSQPDLSRMADSKTYPQGILKKDALSDLSNRRPTSQYGYSGSQNGANDYGQYYMHRPNSGNGQQASEVSHPRILSRSSVNVSRKIG